jgi:hypothetical protein
MGWHVAVASVPQSPATVGSQMSTQYVGVDAPFTSSTHSPVAVTPAG